MRFFLSKTDGGFTALVFSKLLKMLLTYKLEFENGSFSIDNTSKLSELKSLIMDKTKEFGLFMKLFIKGSFRKSATFLFEFSTFLRMIANINTSGKTNSSTVPTYIGMVLSEDSLYSTLVDLASQSPNKKDMVVEALKNVLLAQVKMTSEFEISKTVESLEKLGAFEKVNSHYLNKLSNSKDYHNILVTFFKANKRIADYEDLEISEN